MKAHQESVDGGGDDLGTPVGEVFVSVPGDDSRAAVPGQEEQVLTHKPEDLGVLGAES